MITYTDFCDLEFFRYLWKINSRLKRFCNSMFFFMPTVESGTDRVFSFSSKKVSSSDDIKAMRSKSTASVEKFLLQYFTKMHKLN